jgi:hypothetical protein
MNEANNDQAAEIVEVIQPPLPRGGRWRPLVRTETIELLRHLELDASSRERVQEEAAAILARCVPPVPAAEHSTGLVIGYVQSGKTMSFTTVSAIARDNGFRMVIVITGISTPLFAQSESRLVKDLRLQTRSDRKWQHFSNPKPNDSERRSITDTLADWNDPSVPEDERRTVLITVMKNHVHLNSLILLLGKLNMQNVPVLIIDDEADQAGLNTMVNLGTESPTYQRLLALRAAAPHHTFLQYTATPQAPLLINLIDVLSPRFVELLTPGSLYAGGRDFFLNRMSLIRTIPPSEVPSDTNRLTGPPDSLLEAMRIFFLGVAAGLVLTKGRGNRSMMVHPSQTRTGHRQYTNWVRQVKEAWKSVIEETDNPDRNELLNEFRASYSDLAHTVPDLPSFEALSGRLLHAVRQTRVEEVNARHGKTPQIDWRAAYPYILVGGQAMDRGFTVEGLTVTYMPRSIGVGNADTVQQRARFFGYKRPYLGYCRVYLETTLRAAFHSYVEHEEDIRERLIEHRDTGKPLEEWKRAFFLTTALRPTRKNVIQLGYLQDTVADDWYEPKAPHDSDEALSQNRTVVDAFLARLPLQDDEGHEKRTKDQRHKVAHDIPLKKVYEDLLVPLRVTKPEESARFTGALLQIREYLEDHSDATCEVYLMSGGRGRERSVNDDGEIPNLFQGANYADAAHKVQTYPGDRAIHAPAQLTVQIHNLIVLGKGRGPMLRDNVPAVALWVPGSMSKDWLVQPKSNR